MSLLTKRIFSRVCLRNFQNFKESNLVRTQCYTCLSGMCSIQPNKEKKFGHQRISSLKAVRELNFDFRTVNALFTNTFDRVFASSKHKQRHVGFLWYKSLDEVDTAEFFNLLQLPDTFFSWFRVIELHVWMLLFQMGQHGESLRYLRDGVVEAMWLDLETRARMIDKHNLKFKKNMKQFYEQFRMCLFWYDYGFLESDIALANMIWAVLFERECDDPEKLEAVVRYIRCQVKHLESLNVTNITKEDKKGVWMPLKPHCQRLSTYN